MAKVMICADEASLQNPRLLGLEAGSLEGQDWISAVADAQEARRQGREMTDLQEAWVSCSQDVEPINLAAALKQDRPSLKVCLVADAVTGSVRSRASAACIDEVIGSAELPRRYSRYRQQYFAGASSDEGLVEREVASACPTASSGSIQMTNAPLQTEQEAPTSQAPAPADLSSQGSSHQTASLPMKRGYLLTVTSASGGVGKSTVSVLLACIAASSGRRTVLVDADLQFGDLPYLLKRPDCVRADECVENPRALDKIKETSSKPALIGPPLRMERSEVAAAGIAAMVEQLRERYDVVVVNTGSFWNDVHLQLFEKSSNVLMLVDQRPTSVQAAKHALDLCARCGVATSPFLFAVNRCAKGAVFTSLDVSCALNGVKVAELQDGGKEVEEALSVGAPETLISSGNALAKSLRSVLAEILPNGSDLKADKESSSGKGLPRRKGFWGRRR